MSIYLVDAGSKALERLLEQMGPPVASATYAWNGQQSPCSSVKGLPVFQWLFGKPEWGYTTRSCCLDSQGLWTGSICIHQAQWVDLAERTLERVRTCDHRTHVCVVILQEDERPPEEHYRRACQPGCKALLFDGPKLISMDAHSHFQLQSVLDCSRNNNACRDLVSQSSKAATYSVQRLSGYGQQRQHDQALRSLCESPCMGSSRVLLIVSHDTAKTTAGAFSNGSMCLDSDLSTHRLVRELGCPTPAQQLPNAPESKMLSFAGFTGAKTLDDYAGIAEHRPPSLTPTTCGDLPSNTSNAKSSTHFSIPTIHSNNSNEVECYHDHVINAGIPGQKNDPGPQLFFIRSWLNSLAQRSGTSIEPVEGFLKRSSPIEHVQYSSSRIQDNRTSSDCSNSSDDEWASFDEWTQTHPSLKTGHPLLDIKGQLVQAAIEQYKQQIGATYQSHRAGPDMMNANKNQCQASEDSVEEPSKSELVCPFYKANPVKYSRCLKFSRLSNIAQVKEHLVQQHRLPFYCPVCKKDFQTAKARDQHIIRRTCSLQHGFPFEGVSDDQRRLLARQHKRRDRRQQWRKICELLDLQSVASESPHVKDAVGKEVVEFKDFWRKQGQLCVAEFLSRINMSGWDRRNEEHDLACLYSEVFFGALDIMSQRNSDTSATLGPLAVRTL